MRNRTTILPFIIAAFLAPAIAMADGHAPGFFKRESTFFVYHNLPVGTERATETAAEMVAFSKDGMTVLYSNSQLDSLGMIDITDPAKPKP
ncbi:MAG TPA: alkaline phosphatase, partial [Alphaproteobacteria bacterium]|nr:alkaline phosphatase [Alphaproteobacteria bacterium]